MKKLLSSMIGVLLVGIMLTACTEEKTIDRIDHKTVNQVTATDAVYSDYLYVIEDEDAITELCDMVNSLTYRELKDGEEAPSDLLLRKLYSLSFHDTKNEKTIASVYLSPDGYLVLEDFEHPYVLTSDFDEERLIQLLTDYNTMK